MTTLWRRTGGRPVVTPAAGTVPTDADVAFRTSVPPGSPVPRGLRASSCSLDGPGPPGWTLPDGTRLWSTSTGPTSIRTTSLAQAATHC